MNITCYALRPWLCFILLFFLREREREIWSISLQWFDRSTFASKPWQLAQDRYTPPGLVQCISQNGSCQMALEYFTCMISRPIGIVTELCLGIIGRADFFHFEIFALNGILREQHPFWFYAPSLVPDGTWRYDSSISANSEIPDDQWKMWGLLRPLFAEAILRINKSRDYSP